MKILFIDSVGYKPYTCDTLRGEALGGTEATVLRVARGLAKEGLDVSLFELVDPVRDEKIIDGIRHVNDSSAMEPDVVIHLRTAFLVEGFREQWPKARHIVWMHDLAGPQLYGEPLSGEELVFVSSFHREQTLSFLADARAAPLKSATYIYNPVEIDGYKHAPIEGRLGFFSSPHKGLEQVLELFAKAREVSPELELVVGNPGYMKGKDAPADGVTYLGEMSHGRTLEEMSKCQVLFYPQTVFPETFGLVLAEANAMGVPVLCHDFGAAFEVLVDGTNNPDNEVVDCAVPENVRQALGHLQASKCSPKLDPRFKLENVIKQWKELLGCTTSIT